MRTPPFAAEQEASVKMLLNPSSLHGLLLQLRA